MFDRRSRTELLFSLVTHKVANFLHFSIFSYEKLSHSLSSRGKLLNSGMATLQSFQPSADRFCSWLTRIEETAENLAREGERLKANYPDQSLPQDQIKPFQVGKICHVYPFSRVFLEWFWRFKAFWKEFGSEIRDL